MVDEINKEELQAALEGEAPQAEETSEYSDIEQEAIQHGWNPEGVEGKKNLTADEFMDRKQLYDDLRALKKRNKRLEEKYSALDKHYQHVAEVEREKVIRELKQAKAAALESDDYESVVEIDEKLVEARNIPDKEKMTQEQVNESFNEWKQENAWYETDPEMREYADRIGTGYFNMHNKPDLEEVYGYVAKEVRKKFKDKFAPKSEDEEKRPDMVEGATKGRSSARKTKYSVKDLPEEDRQIMRTLVRTGVLTEEKYLKEYFEGAN